MSGRDKGRGFCFECSTEFDIEMLAHPCPECGSDRWLQDPKAQERMGAQR